MATISKFSDQQQRKSQVNLKIMQVLDLHVGPLDIHRNLVSVLAASYDVRWISLPIYAHGGSHVPFTGDRAPMEAATFPSRVTGRP